MNRWTGRMRHAAVGVAVFGLATACAHRVPPAPPPPDVTVDTVRPERVAEQFEFAGQVEARRQVAVRSPVSGVIVSQTLPEGSEVRAGTVLFQIDTVSYAAAYRGAVAQRADARAHLDNARRTLARLQPLLSSHAVAQLDVDNAQTAAEQAQAAVDNAQAAVDQAHKNLSDATIRAEISGRVGRADMVNGARVTGADEILTTIDQIDTVRVMFRPSIDQVLAWRHDPAAERAAASRRRCAGARGPSRRFGRSARRDASTTWRRWSIRSPAPQSFRAEFPNPRSSAGAGGVRARAAGRPDPRQRAAGAATGGPAVAGSHVGLSSSARTTRSQIRDVVATAWVGNRWLVDSGLVAGDRVIVDGIQKVRPGAVAHPVPAARP